jgi:hypothetical protein
MTRFRYGLWVPSRELPVSLGVMPPYYVASVRSAYQLHLGLSERGPLLAHIFLVQTPSQWSGSPPELGPQLPPPDGATCQE